MDSANVTRHTLGHRGRTTRHERRADEIAREEHSPFDAGTVPLPTGAPRFAQETVAETEARFVLDARDHEGGRAVRAYLEQVFTDFDVRPSGMDLGCTATLCRVGLTFASNEDAQRATSIPADPSRLRLAELRQRDETVDVVLYWDRGEDDAPF